MHLLRSTGPSEEIVWLRYLDLFESRDNGHLGFRAGGSKNRYKSLEGHMTIFKTLARSMSSVILQMMLRAILVEE
jgi:hypothetical protein